PWSCSTGIPLAIAPEETRMISCPAFRAEAMASTMVSIWPVLAPLIELEPTFTTILNLSILHFLYQWIDFVWQQFRQDAQIQVQLSRQLWHPSSRGSLLCVLF